MSSFSLPDRARIKVLTRFRDYHQVMNDLHVTYVWMIALCIYRYQSSFVWFRFLDHYSHTLQYHLAYEQRSLECLDWIPIVFSDWTALGRKEPSVRQFFLWMALFCLMLSNSGFKVQIHIWIWYSHIIIWGDRQADDFNTFPHRSKLCNFLLLI